MENEIILTDFGTELQWCSNCGHQVEFSYEFKQKKCSNCDSHMNPCFLCKNFFDNTGCNLCPFDNQ